MPYHIVRTRTWPPSFAPGHAQNAPIGPVVGTVRLLPPPDRSATAHASSGLVKSSRSTKPVISFRVCGGKLVGDGQANGCKIENVPHLHACAVAVHRIPDALAGFIKCQHRRQQVICLGTQFFRPRLISISCLKISDSPHHPDVCGVERRNFVDVSRDAFQKISRFAVVRQSPSRLNQSFPMCRDGVHVFEDLSCRRSFSERKARSPVTFK